MRSLPQYRQPDPFETFAYRGVLSRPHRSHLHGHGRVLPLFEHPTAELSVDGSTQLGVDPGDLIT